MMKIKVYIQKFLHRAKSNIIYIGFGLLIIFWYSICGTNNGHIQNVTVSRDAQKLVDGTIENFIERKPIAKFLYYVRAFLIDIDLLQQITSDDEFIANPFTKVGGKFNYVYGILSRDLFNWTRADIKNKFKLDCAIERVTGTYLKNSVPTAIYILCPNAHVQLSVFYPRGQFYWIGADETKKRTPKWFGDTVRATQIFKTRILMDQYDRVLWSTKHPRQFLYDYKFSKFLECNYNLADYNLKTHGYSGVLSNKERVFDTLLHIVEVLEGFRILYWLHSGTLLGWYRNCGMLSEIDDIDVSIFASDYDERIKKSFMGNKKVSIRLVYGIPTDMYEFRMRNDYYFFDLFLFYMQNETHMYSGYHKQTRKYFSMFRKFNEICSGELFGYKFLVPCDPVAVLTDNYGPIESWMNPNSKFKWNSISFNFYDTWSDEDWIKVKKIYNKYGKLDFNRTYKYLQQRKSVNISYIEDIND